MLILLYKKMLRLMLPYFPFSAILVFNVWLTGWIATLLTISYIYIMCPDVPPEPLLYLVFFALGMAVFHGWFMGCFHFAGLRPPARFIRYLNRPFSHPATLHAGRVGRRSSMRHKQQLELLYRLMLKMPVLNAAFVIVSSVAAFGAGAVFVWDKPWLHNNIVHILLGGFLGSYIGVYLAYLVTDLYLGDYRQKILRRLGQKTDQLPVGQGMSLFALSMHMAVIFVACIYLTNATLYTVARKHPANLDAAFLFALGVGLVGFVLAYLMYRNIYTGLVNLTRGTRQKYNTMARWFFSKSSNREIATVASSYYQAFRRISRFQQELIREVNLKTHELQEKNQNIEYELELAAEVQRGILKRPQLKNWAHLDVAVHYRPLIRVSGDYYSFHPVDFTQLGFVVGDASGHGVPAALLTMMTHFAFNQGYQEYVSLAYILDYVNRMVLEHTPDGVYLSAFTFLLDRFGMLEYCNAGHMPALLYRSREKRLQLLDTPGLLLGAVEEASFSHKSGKITMTAGDILLTYTDGISEVVNPEGRVFNLANLVEVIEKLLSISEKNSVLHSDEFKALGIDHEPCRTPKPLDSHEAEVLCTAVMNCIGEFQNGARIEDDQTLVIVRYKD